MFGFQGGEPAGVAVCKRDPMKDAQQEWPCSDAREKILIALAGELAVLWAW